MSNLSSTYRPGPDQGTLSKMSAAMVCCCTPLLRLSEESKKYCIISTHRGLYGYTRLPFGVSSSPSIWQKVIEQIVQGIACVVVYFDDLLISASSKCCGFGTRTL